jgi:hypothetical protein
MSPAALIGAGHIGRRRGAAGPPPPRDGGGGWGLVLGIVAIFAIVLFIMALIAVGAMAHDDGRYADSPLKPWFDSLHGAGTGPCCSFADGLQIEVDDWDTQGKSDDVNSGYRVRLDGQWIDVPKDALVTVPNKAGPAFVWPYLIDGKTYIRCFLPGAGA